MAASMADREGWIWYDGKLVPWRDATTHVLTHSLHYGLAVFEGVRAYKTVNGTAIFRLKEHTDRLFNSAHIYMMRIPYSREALIEAQKEVVRANQLESCYIRPIAFYGSEKMGVSPRGANAEALDHGYDEGLLLDVDGFVAEGAGENLFVVKSGKIYEPELTSALIGITRETVIQLAAELGYGVTARRITRDDLYIADEAFFTGTAAEVTPIREADGRAIGTGRRGPLTTKIQKAFFDLVNGRNKKHGAWLTPVGDGKAKKRKR
jgi:branched-chain amino acid aminotransferase